MNVFEFRYNQRVNADILGAAIKAGRLRKSLFALLTVLLLISTFTLPVISQELPKTQPAKTDISEQQPRAHDRGAKDLPIVISVAPSTPLQIEVDRDKEAEKVKAWNETLIAYGTVVIACFTAALAFATIGLAFFTYNLWGETGRLVTGAELTARKQLRAYVNVECVEFVHVEDSPSVHATALWVHVRLKNFGQVPATRIRYRFIIDTEKIPLPATFISHNAPMQQQGVIAPHDTFTAKMEMGAHDIPDSDSAFFVFGEIHYFDGFDPDRVTQLLYAKKGGEDWSWYGQLDVSQHGNHVT